MEDNALLDPFDKLLEELSPPARIRAIEAGGDIEPLWAPLAASGFLDALVADHDGGAGLMLRDIGSLIEALGRHLTPAPVAQTIVARALLTRAGAQVPNGPIAFASARDFLARNVPLAMVARHILFDTGRRLELIPVEALSRTPTGIHASLAADILWHGSGSEVSIARPDGGLRPISAVLHAAQIAGAAGRLLEMTVAYANQRSQFGKPIGKQQAVQQQIAVMAEKVVIARMAARIGCSGALLPSMTAAATAKSVASAAVVDVVAVAHGVHGAIGVSEEHDLQLYTRRLHEWRGADGSESWWYRILGRARLRSATKYSADFVRSIPIARTDSLWNGRTDSDA